MAEITIVQASDNPAIADPGVAVAERMAGTPRDQAESNAEIEGYWTGVEGVLRQVGEEAIADSGKDIAINVVVLRATPATGIAEYANQGDFDIIVMGRRGLGAVRAMLGSVSQRLAHETDLPLLLVK